MGSSCNDEEMGPGAPTVRAKELHSLGPPTPRQSDRLVVNVALAVSVPLSPPSKQRSVRGGWGNQHA